MPRDVRFTPDGARLVSLGRDGTILVWDLHEAAPPLPGDGFPSNAALRECWRRMEKSDAEGFRAGLSLGRWPEHAVAFLAKNLRPEPKRDPKRIARLIRGLDSDDADDRDSANEELRQIGSAAEPDLRAALAKPPSAEVARRVKALMDGFAPTKMSGRELRTIRAVGVLERIGSPTARKLLQELAGGEPHALATQAAKAAVKRLKAD